MSKRHTYFPQVSERRTKAALKAKNRGEVAVKWFADGNKLTKETQPIFNALMKQADKDFDKTQTPQEQ